MHKINHKTFRLLFWWLDGAALTFRAECVTKHHQLQWADTKCVGKPLVTGLVEGSHVLLKGLVEPFFTHIYHVQWPRGVNTLLTLVIRPWNNTGTSTRSPDPCTLHVHSIRCQRASAQPIGPHYRGHLYAHVTIALLICLLNYISSGSPFRAAFVTASDRYAGAAEANKGLRLLWPALPPVTRWYLLRALF